ncbi:Mobile element protein [Micrococcus lylae]|uniref:Mobile element protein n=1 Tax=Micrococcus lylae TaxID=1273 RepID=A0A1R4J6X6_9MICC|nr:Mobile element protein [Micrococcus lylae]
MAPQLGVGEETLRMWCNRYGPAEPSAGPAESLEEENRRLRRELAESRRANEILKAASVFFARELDNPTTK